MRLLETCGLNGALTTGQVVDLRDHVLATVRASVPRPPGPGARIALCGGNARSPAWRFSAGADGVRVRLDTAALARELPVMARRDVAARIKAYDVAEDRAEVMAIAAVILTALAEWAGAYHLVVPGVGVLDGLLLEQAALGIPRRLAR